MTPSDIARDIQTDILSGVLPPGTALSQTELAARFGVSRIPIRDALAQLSAAGVIAARPNRTATVMQMSAADLVEAYDLRLLLECDLLDRAVPQMTAEHDSAISYALERSSLEARQANWATGDQLFHAALYAAAERPRQVAMVDELRRACRIQIAAYQHLPDRTEQWLEDHAAIVAHCRARNTNAAVSRLAGHLRQAKAALLDGRQRG